LEGGSCENGLRLVFAFDDDFCIYPAQKVSQTLNSEIFTKSASMVNNFKWSRSKVLTEFSTVDWLDQQSYVAANWAPLLGETGEVMGVLGVQCPLSTKMSCLSKSGAAQKDEDL
jgi:hypothetical protein